MSEVTLKTKVFQDMVSKALKCSTNNSMLAATTLVSILAKDGKFSLVTTDNVNYLEVSEYIPGISDFKASLGIDQFGKLVSKLTNEYTTLSLGKDSLGNLSYLSIKSGSGNYKLGLTLEDGELVSLEMPVVDSQSKEKIHLSSIKNIVKINKPALQTSILDASTKALLNYYCGSDGVLTSDTSKVALTQIKLFNEPCLINARAMDLLQLMDSEEIQVSRVGNKMTFRGNKVVLSTTQPDGIDLFPAKQMFQYLSMMLDSKCSVSRDEFKGILSRLNLFTTVDSKLLTLLFRKDGIYISTKDSDGLELLRYKASENYKECSASTDITFLIELVDSQSGDNVNIQYGSPDMLKITSENSIQLISLSAAETDLETTTSAEIVDNINKEMKLKEIEDAENAKNNASKSSVEKDVKSIEEPVSSSSSTSTSAPIINQVVPDNQVINQQQMEQNLNYKTVSMDDVESNLDQGAFANVIK